MSPTVTIVAGVICFAVVILALTAVLLYARSMLVNSGSVKISINHGEKILEIPAGSTLLNTLANEKIAPYRIRVGKFGPFIEYDVEGEEKSRSLTLPDEVAPADVDLAFIETLKAQMAKADAPLGTDPDTGLSVYARRGRFGTGDFLRAVCE